MDNERYLYEVRPRRPVNIPGQRATMTRRTLQLTKDEVKEYMKNGPVYRKSTKGEIIQVTGGTLEKLHAPFGSWKAGTEAHKSPAPAIHEQTGSYQPQQPNTSYQNYSGKKNKKYGGNDNNNYHGDDRGKTVTNGGGGANPQYSGNNDQESQQSVAPIVNLP